MDFLNNPTYLYWIVGFVALAAYWMAKPKDDDSVNLKNVVYSALMVFLGLALGAFVQGSDPGGMAIAYAVSTGLAGGTTVKTIAEARAAKKA